MVDTSALESFLNEKSCKENDICEIMIGAFLEEKEDSMTHRKYTVLNLPVSVNGRIVTYSPNKEAIKIFQKEYGLDTDDWVGKKFQIKFYPKTAFGITRNAILPVILKL